MEALMEYPKIETLYDRDAETFKVIVGKWRLSEFEYLAGCRWLFTEKVDGMNVRVVWDGDGVQFGGRTERAQMPAALLVRLRAMFQLEALALAFPLASKDDAVILYGEGYGAGIQKGGGLYKPSGVDFVLFDVLVGRLWLRREDTEEVAAKLGIEAVPLVGSGTLVEATEWVKGGIKSGWGNFNAEGLVLRPAVDLRARNGDRILAKLKTRDF